MAAANADTHSTRCEEEEEAKKNRGRSMRERI
jgi:hypothetical protein